jgi:hypothetical protein
LPDLRKTRRERIRYQPIKEKLPMPDDQRVREVRQAIRAAAPRFKEHGEESANRAQEETVYDHNASHLCNPPAKTRIPYRDED